MGAIPILLAGQERASAPLIGPTINSVEREEMKVAQNPNENPYEPVTIESESKDSEERIVTPTKPTRIISLYKREGYDSGIGLLTVGNFRQ